jgi:mannose-1-phosphate guanylyltransferase
MSGAHAFLSSRLLFAGLVRRHSGQKDVAVAAASHFAVVMAGGSGTRFWPRSRADVPKQLLALVGRRTLLQDAAGRMADVVGWPNVRVVTGARHADAVRRQLPRLRSAQRLVEPRGRDTAAAIALAALALAPRAPRACMIVTPADHVIGNLPRFRKALARAADVAKRTGALVTLGITPTRPETGYGYIRPGAAVPAGGGAAWVERFIEKPDARRAARMIASGGVLWNSGIFVWRVDRILEELERWLPDVVRPLARAMRTGGRAALARAYRAVPAISIDRGVMEHADRVAVVPARFAWNDVGSWAAVGEIWADGRPAANAARGRLLALDSSRCVVDSPSRLVALLGVDDLVVVDSPDAVLVCHKSRVQDVRRVVAELERRGLRRYV